MRLAFYGAVGTRGADLAAGSKAIKMHGEPAASDALRRTSKATLPREPRVPEQGDAVTLA